MEGKGTCGRDEWGSRLVRSTAGEARERKLGEGGADGGDERGIVVW